MVLSVFCDLPSRVVGICVHIVNSVLFLCSFSTSLRDPCKVLVTSSAKNKARTSRRWTLFAKRGRIFSSTPWRMCRGALPRLRLSYRVAHASSMFSRNNSIDSAQSNLHVQIRYSSRLPPILIRFSRILTDVRENAELHCNTVIPRNFADFTLKIGTFWGHDQAGEK